MRARFTKDGSLIISGFPELQEYERQEVIDIVYRELKKFDYQDWY